MYRKAMDAIDQSGMFNVSRSGLLYLSDLIYGKPNNKMQHLTCFAGGMYGLGSHHLALDNSRIAKDSDEHKHQQTNGTNHTSDYHRVNHHFELATRLTETCYQSYNRTPTHLGPENFYFDEENDATNKMGDYYILRLVDS